MREILFRAKRKDDGEWVTGLYTHLVNDKGNETHRIYSGYAETDCGDYYPDFDSVLPETVGEYTGLTDKNGVKIFEGDICHFYGGKYYSGSWESNHVCKIEICAGCLYYLENAEYIEVIGNVYDNPELLGGDDNAAD